MLAYYFPPLGGGGVQRTLKHVKYLAPEGFDAIVVTSDGRGFPLRDPLMATEIPPGTVVLRARTIPVQFDSLEVRRAPSKGRTPHMASIRRRVARRDGRLAPRRALPGAARGAPISPGRPLHDLVTRYGARSLG